MGARSGSVAAYTRPAQPPPAGWHDPVERTTMSSDSTVASRKMKLPAAASSSSAVLGNFIFLLATALSLLIVVRVILSWVMLTGGGPFAAFVYAATEPLLAPIRNFLPPTGAFDLSPMIALVVLQLLTRLALGIH